MDKFKAHILVVDDDDGIRSLVKKYLNEMIIWLLLLTVQRMQWKKLRLSNSI